VKAALLENTPPGWWGIFHYFDKEEVAKAFGCAGIALAR
jgi:hypothetical protein